MSRAFFHNRYPIQEKLAMQALAQVIPVMTQGNIVSRVLAMETIHTRIKKRRKELEMSLQQVAKEVGVSAWQTVQQWEKPNGTAPSRRHMPKVAKVLKTTEHYLLSGEAAATTVAASVQPDEFPIPRYNVRARGGAGQLVPYEYIVGHISVTHSWLRNVLPAITTKDNLRVIEAYGRSMEPTIHEGDLLLVDTGVSKADRDDVYIIQRNNTDEPELLVKRVQRKLDGGITLRSDNSSLYEPETVTPQQLRGVRVLGRVVWIWAGRKA